MATLPAHMTAIGIRQPGGPEVLVPETRAGAAARPGRNPGQGARPPASTGPTSRSARASIRRRPARRDIPGLEIAGEVVALGAGVKRWKLGDKVMALVAGGGYAEYCLAQDSHALPVPPALSMVEAGGRAGNLLHGLAQRVRARRPASAAKRCWCTAARPASAPPRSSSPRRSAPR